MANENGKSKKPADNGVTLSAQEAETLSALVRQALAYDIVGEPYPAEVEAVLRKLGLAEERPEAVERAKAPADAQREESPRAPVRLQ